MKPLVYELTTHTNTHTFLHILFINLITKNVMDTLKSLKAYMIRGDTAA